MIARDEELTRPFSHALPIIASPPQGEGEEGHGHGHGRDQRTYIHSVESKGLALEEVSPKDDVSAFRSKKEASTIELFYDIFFVANLTSFTIVHLITDR